ncbi:MAG: trypsin-like peptidase domain-containing protein [Proteobacteria bacterium]|nr:trypsin-like peptidase domain-containing protein [Pseudomonadota bacterium]
MACFAVAAIGLPVRAALPDTIERIKPSVVVIGQYLPTGNPRFTSTGAGFAVADGRFVITNAHVIVQAKLDTPTASLKLLLRVSPTELQQRDASLVDSDAEHDLALLRVDGKPLAPLAIADSDAVREGQAVAFTGFPIGGVLGFSAVTHRGTISSITPIALPSPSARTLDAKTAARLREGLFDIFQLDATAYPGNSGGPLFDPDSGQVVGIINMVFVKGTKESMLSQPSGITYAIPSKYIAALLQRHNLR